VNTLWCALMEWRSGHTMGLLIIAVLTVASTLSLAGPIIASLLSSDRGMVGVDPPMRSLDVDRLPHADSRVGVVPCTASTPSRTPLSVTPRTRCPPFEVANAESALLRLL